MRDIVNADVDKMLFLALNFASGWQCRDRKKQEEKVYFKIDLGYDIVPVFDNARITMFLVL